MTSINLLLSEVIRPKSLDELTLPSDTIIALKAMVTSGSIMSMVFYGKPGTGKTSAARILISAIDADCKEMNGSSNDGDKTMVKTIKGFAYSYSLINRPKVCFIDEADYMPKAVQDPLRYIIENTSDNCRFLMTANNIGGLSSAIKSRCMPICFDISRKESAEVIDRMTNQYHDKLQNIGLSFDKRKIYEIVSLYFPDFRTIANRFQMETYKTA